MAMDEKKFQSLMNQAEAMRRLPGDQYYHGYLRGLRHFHGDAFGADAENNLWMSLSADDDKSRMIRGQGYQDGFSGILPNPDRWRYCVQNDHGCPTCSLVNSGRDCSKNPV
jgi:hypothetical protein